MLRSNLLSVPLRFSVRFRVEASGTYSFAPIVKILRGLCIADQFEHIEITF